jgi:hypothetical protein
MGIRGVGDGQGEREGENGIVESIDDVVSMLTRYQWCGERKAGFVEFDIPPIPPCWDKREVFHLQANRLLWIAY